MKKWLVKITASFFYIGFLPFAPGTWATLAGFALAWFSDPFQIYLVIFLSVIGFWACNPAEEEVFAKNDPSEFVLDEVIGMLVSVLWLPKEFGLYFGAFFLFRFFDVVKPWPISAIQRRGKPWDIIWDDIAAGIFTNLFLQVCVRMIGGHFL